MKIAVTGGTGFVGRHVLRDLQRQSLRATVACRAANALPEWLTNHDVVIIDVVSPPADCFDVLGQPDVLIHLAWGGLPNYLSRHHFENELPAHYNFLKTLITRGLRNVVVTGTCFEYGMRAGQLQETADPQPNNPYGFAKDALRRELEFLRTTHDFNLVWARLFYLYGDGQAAGSLLPQLHAAVARGAATFDMSGGEQLRDYMPVSDAAAALVSLATLQCHTGVVNICSGVPVSVRRFVENWIDRNGWSIKLNLGVYSYPNYEPFAFWGDRKELNRWLSMQ